MTTTLGSAAIPLIDTGGDPRTRGRQHGEAARDRIERAIGFYSRSFEHSTGLNWPTVLELCPRWVPLIDDYLPGIMYEIAGIAEGANRTVPEILALNARGEMNAGNPFADDAEEGCSSYAITDEASGDGRVYCGQNWDWRSGINDTVIMLRIQQPGKPTVVMQVEAGQIGRHGANSAGIGLNANGLGVRFGKGLGIPQPFIRRKILDATTMHDALEAVFKSTQSLCTNLLISHREGEVVDLETTPGRHGWMYPTDGVLVHANHFESFIPPQLEGSYRPFSPDSLYRTTRIRKVLRHAADARSPEAMRDLIGSALRDHFGYPDSVCNHPQPLRHEFHRTETVASSIVDLTAGEYYLAPGLPCREAYVKLPWNLYADGGGEQPAAEGANGRQRTGEALLAR